MSRQFDFRLAGGAPELILATHCRSYQAAGFDRFAGLSWRGLRVTLSGSVEDARPGNVMTVPETSNILFSGAGTGCTIVPLTTIKSTPS
jgi:hypothetical protein